MLGSSSTHSTDSGGGARSVCASIRVSIKVPRTRKSAPLNLVPRDLRRHRSPSGELILHAQLGYIINVATGSRNLDLARCARLASQGVRKMNHGRDVQPPAASSIKRGIMMLC